MIAAIKPAGSRTRGLLAYLYGPGRHDEHQDPHVVAAFAMLGLPDPGREESATLTKLACHLDEPVRLRNSEFGRKITDHVWHCPVRAAPEDRHLSDAEWGDIARRVVEAAGIAPAGDDLGCRWIAVRHADDHVHILATTVREDGRRPKSHGSGRRVGDACRQIEADYGLRRLRRGDHTAERRPSQAEMHKAGRLGWTTTSREWLQASVRAAIPHVGSAEELLTYLQAEGIAVKGRRGPSGDLLGYALGRPGDLNADGDQIYIAGGKIAPDLSLPKLRARLEGVVPEEAPAARRSVPESAWHRATDALAVFETFGVNGQDRGDAQRVQAQIAALGELLDATAQRAPEKYRVQLRKAASDFARAERSTVRPAHRSADTIRRAVRDIADAATGPDGSVLASLLFAFVWATVASARWHQEQHHEQQAAAARETAAHLRVAANGALDGVFDELARRRAEPIPPTLSYDVRAALPDQADRVLADPAWPALARVLADAEARGHKPHELIKKAAERRELDTARSPVRVLITRVQHAGRNPPRNLTAEAARARSVVATVRLTPQSTPTPAPPATIRRQGGPRR